MNKQDFIKKITEKTGKTQAVVDEVITAMSEVIVEEVRDNGEQIAILGLGTFKQKSAPEREGFNPVNREKIKIKASRTIHFRPVPSVKVFIEPKKTNKKK